MTREQTEALIADALTYGGETMCAELMRADVLSALDAAGLCIVDRSVVEALREAVTWDSHDSEGVPAVWFEQARAALVTLEEGE
jgi:hypothetical protein